MSQMGSRNNGPHGCRSSGAGADGRSQASRTSRAIPQLPPPAHSTMHPEDDGIYPDDSLSQVGSRISSVSSQSRGQHHSRSDAHVQQGRIASVPHKDGIKSQLSTSSTSRASHKDENDSQISTSTTRSGKMVLANRQRHTKEPSLLRSIFAKTKGSRTPSFTQTVEVRKTALVPYQQRENGASSISRSSKHRRSSDRNFDQNASRIPDADAVSQADRRKILTAQELQNELYPQTYTYGYAEGYKDGRSQASTSSHQSREPNALPVPPVRTRHVTFVESSVNSGASACYEAAQTQIAHDEQVASRLQQEEDIRSHVSRAQLQDEQERLSRISVLPVDEDRHSRTSRVTSLAQDLQNLGLLHRPTSREIVPFREPAALAHAPYSHSHTDHSHSQIGHAHSQVYSSSSHRTTESYVSRQCSHGQTLTGQCRHQNNQSLIGHSHNHNHNHSPSTSISGSGSGSGYGYKHHTSLRGNFHAGDEVNMRTHTTMEYDHESRTARVFDDTDVNVKYGAGGDEVQSSRCEHSNSGRGGGHGGGCTGGCSTCTYHYPPSGHSW